MKPNVYLLDFNRRAFIQALTAYRGLSIQNAHKLIDKLWRRGHFSPYEFANFLWKIENISAVALRHITRHRTFRFACSSNRHKKMDLKELKNSLPDELQDVRFNYYGYFDDLSNDELAYFTPATYRYNLVVLTDLRNLVNFFTQRLEKSAHFEIRQIAEAMLDRVKVELPELAIEEWIAKAKWWK